jgi:hypothetical protein
MNKYLPHSLIALFLLLVLDACNVINPKEATPHFLHIDSVAFDATNPVVHGTMNQKITDVWVYNNNNLLGIFSLPADIPILNSAPGLLDVRAGISTNGIAALREPYPMFNVFGSNVNWPAGTKKTIVPRFQYKDQCKFLLQENFEMGNLIKPDNGDTTFKVYAGPEVFEGATSAYTYIDKTKPLSRTTFQDQFNLKPGRKYYFEMNYKCNTPISIHLSTVKAGVYIEQQVAGVNPKATWNKIYFNVGELVNSISSPAPYNLIIKSELLPDSTSGYAYIDNIKLIELQ